MSATQLRIEPAAIGLTADNLPELLCVARYSELSSVRMLGGCRIGSEAYWYRPDSDWLVRSDVWAKWAEHWAEDVETVEDYAP